MSSRVASAIIYDVMKGTFIAIYLQPSPKKDRNVVEVIKKIKINKSKTKIVL